MTAPTTSLAQGGLPATTARGEWRRYAQFLAAPALPKTLGSQIAGAKATARMLALDLMVMVALIGTIFGVQAAGFEIPENVNETLKPDFLTLALIVIAAPLLEELAFRSWLRGHPAVIAAALIAIAGLVALPAIGASMEEGPAQLATMLSGLALAAIVLPLVAYRLRNQTTPAFFTRTFPVWFWLSTLGFALIHLSNYSEGSLAILLPLVLPQFALGTMLGYLRVHYGLAYAIALHASHNAILFTLAVMGGLGETPAAAA